MSAVRQVDAHAFPVPERLNLALLVLSGAAASACLWSAAHVDFWLAVACSAVAFSFFNNTLFSLLHEATHGIAHRRQRVNDWMGRAAAVFFPTSYSTQRAFHLTHHKHNRSDFEQFDYLRPGDNRLLKYAQWYAILTGLYWMFAPLFCIGYGVSPRLFAARWLASAETTIGHQTAAAVYLDSVRKVPPATVRFEVGMAVIAQLGLFWLLDLSWTAWTVCYAAFAVNWSALQYADHAWSPLHRTDGAWNLRVNALTKLPFLNYHDHLAHHRHPGVPWLYLPRLVETDAPRPSFLCIYLRMWRGPRPIAEAVPTTVRAARG